jgi:hypothetical protein
MHLTMHLDRAGCVEPRFRWVSTATEGLAVLRDQSFDCVLISGTGGHGEIAGDDAVLGALSFVRAARAAGYCEPILLLTPALSDGQWSEFCASDCDLLVTPTRWDCPALVPMLCRLMERREIRREHRRLGRDEHRRLLRERDEAEELLRQQRQMLGELARLSQPSGESQHAAPEPPVPEQVRLRRVVDDRYQELLRAYVMLGSENLGREIAELVETIALAGLTPRDVLQLHVERVESLLAGLGDRSARHVVSRAELMALELMVCLGDSRPQPEVVNQNLLRAVRGEGGIDLTAPPEV